MKPIEKLPSFDNPTILNDFWEVRKINFSNIHGKRLIQMGYTDDHVKSTLLKMIQRAEHTIFLATFLLSDDDIVKALEQTKARVYILTSNDALLDRERQTDLNEYNQQVVDHHKSILKKISTSCLVRGSSHLHAKFLLVDPLTKPQGLMLTSNVTKEALLRNPELAVILSKEEIEELFHAFRYVFWNDADQELQDRKWAAIAKRSFSLQSLNQITTTIKGHNTLEQNLIDEIKRAKGTLHVGAYKISDSTTFFKELVRYAERHEVVVYTRLHPANQAVYTRLSALPNVTLIAAKFLHAKFVISDSSGMVTTANFNDLSFADGFEVAVQLQTTKEILNVFSSWQAQLEYYHIAAKSIATIETSAIMMLQSGSFVEKTIKESTTKPNKFTANTMAEFIAWRDREVPTPVFNMEKKVIVDFKVSPPTVPKKAKRVEKKTDIKNSQLLEGIDELFDKKDQAKYNLFLDKKDLYLEIETEKEYNKLRDKVPSHVIIVTKLT